MIGGLVCTHTAALGNSLYIFLESEYLQIIFFPSQIFVLFPYVHLTAQIFILDNLFVYLLGIFTFFIFLSILMVIISLELTRVNPDRNIFSINVELTSTFYSTEVWSITITEF